MKLWSIHIACWTSKAKNTHSEYVILIAFPLQQVARRGCMTTSHCYVIRILLFIVIYLYVRFEHKYFSAPIRRPVAPFKIW
jgi:hypothetical protein